MVVVVATLGPPRVNQKHPRFSATESSFRGRSSGLVVGGVLRVRAKAAEARAGSVAVGAGVVVQGIVLALVWSPKSTGGENGLRPCRLLPARRLTLPLLQVVAVTEPLVTVLGV